MADVFVTFQESTFIVSIFTYCHWASIINSISQLFWKFSNIWLLEISLDDLNNSIEESECNSPANIFVPWNSETSVGTVVVGFKVSNKYNTLNINFIIYTIYFKKSKYKTNYLSSTWIFRNLSYVSWNIYVEYNNYLKKSCATLLFSDRCNTVITMWFLSNTILVALKPWEILGTITNYSAAT